MTPTRRLTARQFEIVALMWHERMNYTMIAERLGISERTVMAHVQRASMLCDGHGPPAWKVLCHAGEWLEMGFSDDPAEAETAA